MKLIVLYGPPAAGKYTLAKLVAEKTGYKFFHNHLTIDVLKPVLEFGTKGFFDLVDKIRLDIFEEAARQNIPGMVFTFVYRGGGDDSFVQELQDRVAKYGGEVKFIQIYCEKPELVKRVVHQHRVVMDKLTDPDELWKMMEEGEFLSPVPNADSTRIDNTHLTVAETFKKVMAIIENS